MICKLCASDVIIAPKSYCTICKTTRYKIEKEINDNFTDPDANMEQIVSDAPLGTEKGQGLDTRFRISCISHRKRLADFDGISYKAAIDGLKTIGVLSDDSTKFVSEEATINQKKAVGEEFTVIEIWGC